MDAGASFAKLYESKSAFEAIVSRAIEKLMAGSYSFSDTVILTGRLAGNGTVNYVLANNQVFKTSTVRDIAKKIFWAIGRVYSLREVQANAGVQPVFFNCTLPRNAWTD